MFSSDDGMYGQTYIGHGVSSNSSGDPGVYGYSYDRTFVSFEEARKFVRSLGLKNQEEWAKYLKSGKKPYDIPSNAHIVYKDSWKSFGDWLGTDVVAPQKRQYLPFVEARKYVQSFGLKRYESWREYCKSGNKQNDIPSKPDYVYRGKGWIDWYDWLGYQSTSETKKNEPKQKLTLSLSKRTIEEAKSMKLNISALTENLLNVLTYDQMESANEHVIKSYGVFFGTLIPLVTKYGAKVEVGLKLHDGFEHNNNSSSECPIRLDDSGLRVWHDHMPKKTSIEEVLDYLYSADKILENTILALIEASKNKGKVENLLFALRFARSLSKEVEMNDTKV